jgi:hypothetical protein
MEVVSLPKGAIKTDKQIPVDTNRVNRSYYLNLFSSVAEKGLDASGTKNATFKWNIRDLQLGSKAEVALVQMIHTSAANNTGYTFRILETFADGYDAYNQTSAIVYMGLGLNAPSIPTYHKLISNNLNTITIIATDDNSSATAVYGGIGTTITFGFVLHILDYMDKENTY